jgi:hypothetical protein
MGINGKLHRLDELDEERGILADLVDLSPTAGMHERLAEAEREYHRLRDEVKEEIAEQEEISEGRRRHGL